MGDVIEKLAFVSHITACIWMYIGYTQLLNESGWIYTNHSVGL